MVCCKWGRDETRENVHSRRNDESVSLARTWFAEKFPVVNLMMRELLPAPDSPSVQTFTGFGVDAIVSNPYNDAHGCHNLVKLRCLVQDVMRPVLCTWRPWRHVIAPKLRIEWLQALEAPAP